MQRKLRTLSLCASLVAAVLIGVSAWFIHRARLLANVTPISYRSGDLKITGLMSKPPGEGPFPVIFVNHGGFDPASSVAPLLQLCVKLGYVAIASNYRGVADAEGQREVARGEVDDILNAIVYAKSLAYVDASRVVMLGFSHGGTIALLAAARDPEIKAVVTVGAPVEFAECYRHWVDTLPQNPVLKPLVGISIYVGGTPDEKPEAWRARSPLYVAEKIHCPVLMIQGGKDIAVPPEQAERMIRALQAGGNSNAQLLADAEAGHVLDGPAYQRVGKSMVAFLARYSRPSAQ